MSMFKGPAGLASLLKEGTRHFQGLDEAVYRNIDAAKKFQQVVCTCYGPTGMAKLISNFLDKRFLTSDASTITSELEVQHPAVKVLVMAAQMQNTEFGDATNFVLLLAAELLVRAGELMRTQGIHVSAVIKGYELGLGEALKILEGCVVKSITDLTTKESLLTIIEPVVSTKVRGSDRKLLELIVEACLAVMPKESPANFDTDNVRVCKLTGGTMSQSFTNSGMVLHREPKTACKVKTNCKICIIGTALEIAGTEGSSTVLIKKSEDLMNFSKGEENEMEALIKGFHDRGVEAIICGGAISPLALHFLDKYDMWALATPSKFDIKRYSRTLRIPALQRIAPPMAEEIGSAEYAGVQEIGSQMVTIVRAKDTKVSTIVLRGAARTSLDEAERAIDDAVSLIKACTKDSRFVAGAGAVEAHLAMELDRYSQQLSGLEQYSAKEFANSFWYFVKLLAEHAGQNAMETVTKIKVAHRANTEGSSNIGVDVTRLFNQVTRDTTKPIVDVDESSAFKELSYPVFDHYVTKQWALRLAVDAALTVLRIDQIIMAKPAGGPKFPNQGHWDAADDRTPAF